MNIPLLSLLLFLGPALAVWPQPRVFQWGNTYVKLDPNFNVTSDFIPPQDLGLAVSRTLTHLRNDLFPMLLPNSKTIQDNKNKVAAANTTIKILELSLVAGKTPRNITDEVKESLKTQQALWSESYQLIIPASGTSATLKANTTLGLLRGLMTFEQLWFSSDGTVYNHEAPVTITDWPAYPYRGFMLDTARNYFPVTDIMRTFDAMSMVKLNYFHWRIVDTQSFPLVVPGHESLSENGAYLATSTYNATDVQNVIDYAYARGIDVVVEMDVPGHLSVIGNAYPEHVACYRATPWAKYSNEPPAGMLRFANDSTLVFITQLLGAVANMFPSKLFSIGGDALKDAEACYHYDNTVANLDLGKNNISISNSLNNFVDKIRDKLVQNNQKTVMVWDDSVIQKQIPFTANETLVLVNHDANSVTAVARKNLPLIHASSNFFYLDCGAGVWFGNNPGGNSWCDPFKTWQKMYSFNPTEGLSGDQVNLVMGGESMLWSEQTDPSNLDPIAWPRAAAPAAVFWTGQDREPVGDAFTKIQELRYRMVGRGIKAIALTPQWCAMNGSACDINS